MYVEAFLPMGGGGASTKLHFWTKNFISVLAIIKKNQLLFTF
jgi:hypothetical protein